MVSLKSSEQKKISQVYFWYGTFDLIFYPNKFLKLKIIREIGEKSGLKFSYLEKLGGY